MSKPLPPTFQLNLPIGECLVALGEALPVIGRLADFDQALESGELDDDAFAEVAMALLQEFRAVPENSALRTVYEEFARAVNKMDRERAGHA